MQVRARAVVVRRVATSSIVASMLLVLLSPLAAAVEYEVVEIDQAAGVPAGCAPQDIDLDPSGKPWITCKGASKIITIDPASKRAASYEVPTKDSEPFMGVFDPSGSYWFSESNAKANKVARLDKDGNFKEFAVPANGTSPRGLAFDSSGNLWVALWTTGPDADKVGKLVPGNGQWDVRDMPEAQTGISDVAFLRSGKLLVCDLLFGKMFTVDPSSFAITKLAIPTVFELTWCREDPKGNVWGTSHGTNTLIMRLNPDLATWDNYTIPQSGLFPYAVGFDPSGKVWWTEHIGNHIHGIDPATKKFEPRIPLPSGKSYPFSIAIDGKGNLWVGESAVHKIAFVSGEQIVPPDGGGFPVVLVAAVAGVGVAVVVVLVVVLMRKKAKAPPEARAAAGKKKEEL